MQNTESLTIPNVNKDMKQRELSYPKGGSVHWYNLALSGK